MTDPMATDTAPLLPHAVPERVMDLEYSYDWLANMTYWSDDAQQFYERSIGDITNGFGTTVGTHAGRPSALYLASDLPGQSTSYHEPHGRGGYVELDYGVGGNVTRMTVHAQCADAEPLDGVRCFDNRSLGLDARKAHLREHCVCAEEQHYQYRWDELNRMSEARRYDREGSGNWALAARQRYRYDSANQRTVKQTLDITHTTGTAGDGLNVGTVLGTPVEHIALYVYPGDFERRGLIRIEGTDLEYASPIDGNSDATAETQYLVGGARIVRSGRTEPTGTLDPNDRITVGITDLIQTTSAVVDLVSGALVETSTYYPNGARETYRAPDTENVAAEPYGFTGKEADEEVGVTYFGERYLIARVGRWASPDPLSIHAAGGGEALNAFHYVSGNLLQARDPLGLDPDDGSGGASGDAHIKSPGPGGPMSTEPSTGAAASHGLDTTITAAVEFLRQNYRAGGTYQVEVRDLKVEGQFKGFTTQANVSLSGRVSIGKDGSVEFEGSIAGQVAIIDRKGVEGSQYGVSVERRVQVSSGLSGRVTARGSEWRAEAGYEFSVTPSARASVRAGMGGPTKREASAFVEGGGTVSFQFSASLSRGEDFGPVQGSVSVGAFARGAAQATFGTREWRKSAGIQASVIILQSEGPVAPSSEEPNVCE